jgi:hypothetical protein
MVRQSVIEKRKLSLKYPVTSMNLSILLEIGRSVFSVLGSTATVWLSITRLGACPKSKHENRVPEAPRNAVLNRVCIGRYQIINDILLTQSFASPLLLLYVIHNYQGTYLRFKWPQLYFTGQLA